MCAALSVGLVTVATAVAVAPKPTPEGIIPEEVFVGGVLLGGRTEDEARVLLDVVAREGARTKVTLTLGGRELPLTAGELGYALDVEETLARAKDVEMAGGIRGIWRSISRSRTDVAVAAAIDRDAILEKVPAWETLLIDDPPIEGTLDFSDGKAIAKYPTDGRVIRKEELVLAIVATLEAQTGGTIEVPVDTVSPVMPREEIERAEATANLLLAGPIALTYTPDEEVIARVKADNAERERRAKEDEARRIWKLPKKSSRLKKSGRRMVEEAVAEKPKLFPLPEPLTVTFSTDDLFGAVRAHRVDTDHGPTFAVYLDEAEVKRKLAPTVAKLYNAARDARFEIGADSRVTIVPSQPGTRVDTAHLVEALQAAAEQPDRTGTLPVDNNAEPLLTTKAATALGIVELVSEFTTKHPCCAPRVKNIHRICDMLDGTIVKAGDTFSVNSAVGPRTIARGFFMAPSIGDGEITETPGGGVSQFATTLYNALYDGGYSVRSHKPHSIYFKRYPMGVEATLSFPQPDLVFMNDRKSAMLLRCNYDDTSIRVRLFGAREGRSVVRKLSSTFDFSNPKTDYVPNRRRSPKKNRIREYGSNGFSVQTTRIITYGDGTTREEKRTVKYNGHSKTIEAHPCRIPRGETGYTGEACPSGGGDGDDDSDAEESDKGEGH